MSPYRIVLLVLFVPCFVSWLSGRAGKMRLPDLLLLAYCLWCLVCLAVHQGIGPSIASFGMQLVETMGAFLLARCTIRTADDFFAMVRTLFILILFLLPLAIVEAVSHRNVSMEIFSHIFPTESSSDSDGVRMGLQRVQSVFGHPILFGLFSASCFSLTHIVLGYRKTLIVKNIRTLAVAFAALLSLSSAPIGTVMLQILLLSWNALLGRFRQRWAVLIGIGVFFFIVIEFTSNQGAFGVYISYLTFNAQSGFYRIAIWEYGTASILNNPIFGVGMGEWVRAFWMTSSIDNFWLLNAIRWGVVGGALIALAVLASFLQVAFAKQSDDRASQYKLAYLLAVFAHIFTGWTVHFWGSSYVFFLFLLGSGSWLLETGAPTENRMGRSRPERQGRRQGDLRNLKAEQCDDDRCTRPCPLDTFQSSLPRSRKPHPGTGGMAQKSC